MLDYKITTLVTSDITPPTPSARRERRGANRDAPGMHRTVAHVLNQRVVFPELAVCMPHMGEQCYNL